MEFKIIINIFSDLWNLLNILPSTLHKAEKAAFMKLFFCLQCARWENNWDIGRKLGYAEKMSRLFYHQQLGLGGGGISKVNRRFS